MFARVGSDAAGTIFLRLSAVAAFPALENIENKLRPSAQAVQRLQHGCREDRQALLFQFEEESVRFLSGCVSQLQQVAQGIGMRFRESWSFLPLLEFVVLRAHTG